MSIASKMELYWKKTRSHMLSTLVVWFFFAFVLHFFVGYLNNILFIGFPLGYYMSAQGSLFAFVVIIFWFAWRQNKIDEEFDLHE